MEIREYASQAQIDTGDLVRFDWLARAAAARFRSCRSPTRDMEQYADAWLGLMKAHRRWPQYQGRFKSFEAFAWMCVFGSIRDGLRHRGGRPSRSRPRPQVVLFSELAGEKGLLACDPLAEPADLDEGSETLLERALSALNPRERDVFVKYFVQGYSVEIIAELLTPRLTPPYARKIIDQGLHKIRRLVALGRLNLQGEESLAVA
jgi:RNA polymerase sigma factor (sigma-70 family)